jgi:hypothetical protein
MSTEGRRQSDLADVLTQDYRSRKAQRVSVETTNEKEDLELYRLIQLPVHGHDACGILRPGCRFSGSQQSHRQIYNVEVSILNVSVTESFMSCFLQIKGLTEEHPSITTYFEAEAIGAQYGFNTRHPSWGTSYRGDLNY